MTLHPAGFVAAALLLVACEADHDRPERRVGTEAVGALEPKAPAELPRATEAKAHLEPTEGQQANGTITFRQREDEVHVSGDLHDVPPGEHGFHVHQWGDCDSPDASSAGGHFDPRGMPHGGPKSDMRHVGDLGNVAAKEPGRTRVDFVDRVIALNGPKSIVGRALVLHASADDLETAPSGDAGARIACGVIGVVAEDPPAVATSRE